MTKLMLLKALTATAAVAARDHGLDLSNGILIHSGGWKKLVDKAVSPEARGEPSCGVAATRARGAARRPAALTTPTAA